jgi:hypothetical protein
LLAAVAHVALYWLCYGRVRVSTVIFQNGQDSLPKKMTPVSKAAFDGDVAKLSKLLKSKKTDLNQRDTTGK